jgi:hypothetical protein
LFDQTPQKDQKLAAAPIALLSAWGSGHARAAGIRKKKRSVNKERLTGRKNAETAACDESAFSSAGGPSQRTEI